MEFDTGDRFPADVAMPSAPLALAAHTRQDHAPALAARSSHPRITSFRRILRKLLLYPSRKLTSKSISDSSLSVFPNFLIALSTSAALGSFLVGTITEPMWPAAL